MDHSEAEPPPVFDRGFNWVFLIELLVFSLLTLWFLFYFNRLFASLVSYAIRSYTWYRYRVYLDIEALQISLLGGRVFFKGLRYHGSNETIMVHDGYITWRYWIRRVRQAEYRRSKAAAETVPQSSIHQGSDGRMGISLDEESPSDHAHRNLPCRVEVEARGVEWFIYNRSQAYETIWRSMSKQEASDKTHLSATPTNGDTSRPNSNQNPSPENLYADILPARQVDIAMEDLHAMEKLHTVSTGSDSCASTTSSDTILPNILRVLPVKLACNKGAIVMGNQNTRSILTARFDNAVGYFEACNAGSLDEYRQSIDFDFIHPIVQFKKNLDFKEIQIKQGERQKSDIKQKLPLGSPPKYSMFKRQIRKVLNFFRALIYHSEKIENGEVKDQPVLTGSHGFSEVEGCIPGHNRWIGLSRYLDVDDDLVEQEKWKGVEYGQFPTIIDSPKIAMNLYWDIPGLVPMADLGVHQLPADLEQDINGSAPPGWGVNLRIYGGNIKYGPWADRQRADLQNIFFPSLYKDAVPGVKLEPGQPRISTRFKLVIEIEEQTTLGIPTREESKDWKWKGRMASRHSTDVKQKPKKDHAKRKKPENLDSMPEVRSFGWLDIKLFTNSTISCLVDLVATSIGFTNRLDLDLRGSEILTSVNHGLLLRSQSQKISCDLSYPLKWSETHPWHIDIKSVRPEIFLLRDHIFLLTDLVNDWTSGPLAEFYSFVPYHYAISFHFENFEFYFNANDHNIINNPSDVDDNIFAVIHGKHLNVSVNIPLTNYRSTHNRVTFNAAASDGGMKLLTPRWNTYHTFLDDLGLATMKALRLDGSYDYHTSNSSELTDTMVLNIYGEAPNLHLHGFLVRYVINLKDNYFGEDIHFRTLEEYQTLIDQQDQTETVATAHYQHTRLSNDLDIILGVSLQDLCVLLPTYIYSASKSITMDMSSLAIDLRFTNYYMDLGMTFSPLSVSQIMTDKRQDVVMEPDVGVQIFIDGVEISSHRLFGLPPAEPTYVCNWDFDVGSITGECCADFLQCLLLTLQSLVHTFEDAENALACPRLQVVHDVTFLRAGIQPICIWLRLEEEAFLLSSDAINIRYNDLAGELFSEHLYVTAPRMNLGIFSMVGAQKSRSSLAPDAFVNTALDARMVRHKPNFMANRQLQQNHISHQDTRTHRVPWLASFSENQTFIASSDYRLKTKAPAMPFPPMPEPVREFHSFREESSTAPSANSVVQNLPKTPLKHKSSFLSTPSRRRNKAKRSLDDMAKTHQNKTSKQREEPVSCSNLNSYVIITDNESLDFTFSSSYKVPHFTLLQTNLDLDAVPEVSTRVPLGTAKNDISALEASKLQFFDQNLDQSSFMLHLNQGIRALGRPAALKSVEKLLQSQQKTNSVALLDGMQIATPTEESSSGTTPASRNKAIELRVTVPFIKSRFVYGPVRNGVNASWRHEYDLSLHNLLATARYSERQTNHDNDFATVQQSSLHLLLHRMTCSARETQKDKTRNQTIIRAVLNNLVCWIMADSGSAANLQLKDFEFMIESDRACFVVSLLENTLMIIHEFIQRLSRMRDGRKLSSQNLVLFLCTNGDNIPDPPFLTRASYLMRSTNGHSRSSESWKILSRLRYIYESLSDNLQNQAHAECMRESLACPQDVGTQVIKGFENWHAWDVALVEKSHLMQTLYGPLIGAPDERQTQEPHPLRASFKAEKIRFLIRSVENTNEIMTEMIALGVVHNQPLGAKNTTDIAGASSVGTIIQTRCAATTIAIDWSLHHYLEAVNDILKRYPQIISAEDDRAPRIQTLRTHYRLHVLVSLKKTTISLDGINLQATADCHDSNASFVLESELQGQRTSANLIISSHILTTRVRSFSKHLSLVMLNMPQLSASINSASEVSGTMSSYSLAGALGELFLEITEEPTELIKIAGLVLRDEVMYFSSLSQKIKQTSGSSMPPKNSTRGSHAKFSSLSISLGSYYLRFIMLPSLVYSISGKEAQILALPRKSQKWKINIDLDIRDHSHTFVTQIKGSSEDISDLHIPSINGRLTLDLRSEQRSALIHIAVETVNIDAAALYTLADTLSHPEIGSLITNMNQGFALLKSDWHHQFSSTYPKLQGTAQRPDRFMYVAYVSFASIVVRAKTQRTAATAGFARLVIDLGPMQMMAANKIHGAGQKSEFPDLCVKFQDIKLNLVRVEEFQIHPCGDVKLSLVIESATKGTYDREMVRAHQVRSNYLNVNVYSETASMMLEILGYLQDTLKTIDESKEVRALRRLTRGRVGSAYSIPQGENVDDQASDANPSSVLFNAMYALEMAQVAISWKIGANIPISPGREAEDLVLSFVKIDLATRKENAARLLIEGFQLQMIPALKHIVGRSTNSALLPEIVFNVAYLSTRSDRRLAFQAAGKPLDLRLTPQFILPASDLRRSMAIAVADVRRAIATWDISTQEEDTPKRHPLGQKRLSSLLIDADFAGAVVYIQGQNPPEPQSLVADVPHEGSLPQRDRHDQFANDDLSGSTTLRSPGVALKIEYRDTGTNEPSLNAEFKVDASSNIIYPSVVPLIMEISSSIKETFNESDKDNHEATPNLMPEKQMDGEQHLIKDPSTIFGNCKLNLGLWIHRQEFTLSCKPVAQVATTAHFQTIYVTVNTVQSKEYGQFFTLSAIFNHFEASVQHVYSRESTGSLSVESIVLSIMSSKHISTANGLSAILKVSPISAQINAKQLHDFQLFREIWIPSRMRNVPPINEPASALEGQVFNVQNYQQAAAASAFPWVATVSIANLNVQVDLGQSLGRSTLTISSFWVASTKSSNWEHSLCLGFDKISINSIGRMSGQFELQHFGLRTSIHWTAMAQSSGRVPLVQASARFDQLRMKVAFEFQPFLVAEISAFEFLMYNVRDSQKNRGDRLVGVLDGQKVQIYCTTTSASQGLALYQTFDRVLQEKRTAYEAALKDIQKLLRRDSSNQPVSTRATTAKEPKAVDQSAKAPLQLQTVVIVNLRAVNVGAFPSTLLDSQIFKIEALDASARFAIVSTDKEIHSTLSMTLGQLRIALSSVLRAIDLKPNEEFSIDDVVANAMGSRGGTILKVPKVIATMQTWQSRGSNHIQYIFGSSFHGKVDVGWNYSRISFLRGMWAAHSRALAQRWGKPLPPSALKITGGLQREEREGETASSHRGPEKITAVINVPQSKYQYTALQPPIIETPQLRDMGEATPPLEWIGLHRERLPTLTHQIIIVSLLEVAKEVEDAYHSILGAL